MISGAVKVQKVDNRIEAQSINQIANGATEDCGKCCRQQAFSGVLAEHNQ